jgi:hypothetical protein
MHPSSGYTLKIEAIHSLTAYNDDHSASSLYPTDTHKEFCKIYMRNADTYTVMLFVSRSTQFTSDGGS